MPHANVSGPPLNQAGVRQVAWSSNGAVVYAQSFQRGLWTRANGTWSWIDSDFVVQLLPHPTSRDLRFSHRPLPPPP